MDHNVCLSCWENPCYCGMDKERDSRWLLIDDVRTYNVDIARNYHEAMTKLEEKVYEGIMLDYQLSMSGPTGLDVLERLVLLDRVPAKIFIVSTHPIGVDKIKNCLDRINYHYIEQPYKVDDMTLPGYWTKRLGPKPKRKVTVSLSSLRR